MFDKICNTKYNCVTDYNIVNKNSTIEENIQLCNDKRRKKEEQKYRHFEQRTEEKYFYL